MEDAIQCTSHGECTDAACSAMVEHMAHEEACSPVCSALNDITKHISGCREGKNDCYICLYAQQRKLQNLIVVLGYWMATPPPSLVLPSAESFKNDLTLRRQDAQYQLYHLLARLDVLKAPTYSAPPLRLHYVPSVNMDGFAWTRANDPITQYIYQLVSPPVISWEECVAVCVSLVEQQGSEVANQLTNHVRHVVTGNLCDQPECVQVQRHANHRRQCQQLLCPYCQLSTVLRQKHKWQETCTKLDKIIAEVHKVAQDRSPSSIAQLQKLQTQFKETDVAKRVDYERLLMHNQLLHRLLLPHTPVQVPALQGFVE
ncbi:hypothetical protein ACHHYP_05543 [Achlya hypogyna]|uniref:TAZ-type domain-containing protein n=1 Tax=Achlya hypogyna TaxID=1202772 RepID=A0A1V9ZNR9_ACHHY|nr:hypothetical protein ACHHYP_05543 [Achlya hypogyna]